MTPATAIQVPPAEEERRTSAPVQRRPWVRRLLAECLRYRGLLAVTLAVTIIAVVVDLVAPLLAKAAMDTATGSSGTRFSIGVIVAALVTLALVRYACQFGRRVSAGRLSIVVQNSLRLRLLDTVLHLDGHAQNQIRTGQIVSRSISDLQIVQSLLAMAPLSAGAAIQVVVAIGIMAYLSPMLTCVALLVFPLVAVVVFRTRRKLFAATWSAQQAAADVAQHVEETVTGVRVVKGFGQEERAVDELVGLGSRLFSLRLRAGRINARFTPTMAAIPQLGMVAVIAVGGYLTLRGHITAGTFLAFATYIASMTALARLLTNLVVSGQLARAAIDRVYDVIEHPRDRAEHNTATVPTAPLGLRLNDIGFAFDDGRPLLDGLDLTVAPGECVAVVGPPGSGKSTLADLIGRYHRPDSGVVELVGTDGAAYPVEALAADSLHAAVSVVFDEPFLYSDTVAANIALGPAGGVEPDDPSDPRHRRLVSAAERADAIEFIDALPDGFGTVVGERGLTLSGGQRQRVALARALYADPRILVLDDATSAVDAQTEARILGRLRDGPRTMLMLAHRRSTLALADRVAVLDGGRIVDIGTVPELDARCQLFRSLMASSDPEVAADTPHPLLPRDCSLDELWPENSAATVAAPGHRSAPAPATGPGGGGPRAGGGMGGALGSMPATPELLRAVAALPPADEQPRVDVTAARSDSRTFSLAGLLTPVRWLLTVAVACIALDTLIGLAFPSLARAVVDAATRTDESTLVTVTVIGVALVAFDWLASSAMTITSTRAGERVLFGLRVRSYAHLQRLGLDYYERELSGRIMTRMTTDVDALSTFLQTGLSSAIVAALTLVGVTVALVVTNPLLGGMILPVFPVLVVATLVFRRVSSVAYTRSRELVSLVNADFQENIAGIKTTQTYRHTDTATKHFTARTLAWVEARMVSQKAIATYFPFISLMSDLATAVAIAVGAHEITRGTMSSGTLVAFVLYLSMLFGPVQQLTQVFDGYQQAVVGLRRISDLLRTPSSLVRRDGGLPVSADGFDGNAALDDVTFRYAGSDRDALTSVRLDIEPGTSLALVGKTGAGKSTIVKLLARFYDPTTGAVRMDGTDIREFELSDYRHRLGVVPQEAHLFAGTIADNIAYGRPAADRSTIASAARAVGATDMIAGLPGGMNHRIGERGQGLSSGQRQLVALARAELVGPDLLLLDEATATLDQATEALVLAAGEALTRRRTAVIVAHRLATAARADLIAVVDAGRIVEMGTHAELLALNRRYRAFWEAGIAPEADGVATPGDQQLR